MPRGVGNQCPDCITVMRLNLQVFNNILRCEISAATGQCIQLLLGNKNPRAMWSGCSRQHVFIPRELQFPANPSFQVGLS